MSSYENTRFTLMAFPQKVNANGKLDINILFIPRNINPLKNTKTGIPSKPEVDAFADLVPDFQIIVSGNPDEFPGKFPPAPGEIHDAAGLNYPGNARKIYEALSKARDASGNLKYFDIDDEKSSDGNVPLKKQPAPAPFEKQLSVKKYLPMTYRESFNFTAPRTPNAVIDDSYHCAMREQKPPVDFQRDKTVSWGKVYAYLLRNPLLAIHAGLLYKTSITLQKGELANGGWIYVTPKTGTDFAELLDYTINNPMPAPDSWPFIKRYAARIPVLKPGDGKIPFEERNLFTALLFPVMNPGKDPAGIFDEVFFEAATYNEGFAAIVHANQPVSQNLLQESPDGIHPQKDIGIRLGWDDEQILIWYMRQMSKDENAGNDRLDVPLGVNGYHIDVREENHPKWESLNMVSSLEDLYLEDILLGPFEEELPYQVFPSKAYGSTDNYWLPMYFANWNDHSLVLPDSTATELYAIDQVHDCIDPETNSKTQRIVSSSNLYKPAELDSKLRYGHNYLFRIRMRDISGGGPAVDSPVPDDTPGRVKTVRFIRYIAPHSLELVNPFYISKEYLNDLVLIGKAPALEDPDNNIYGDNGGINFAGETITVKRPKLGYPAVVYTDKYLNTNINDLLIKVKDDIIKNHKHEVVGLPDPDVDKVEIKVEVETLQMDNLASDNGKENYITLYTTTRAFDKVKWDQIAEITDIEAIKGLPLKFAYKDFPQLNLGNTEKPFPVTDPDTDNESIKGNGDLPLPTNRNIRVTLRALSTLDDSEYWNIKEKGDPGLDSRCGKPTVLKMRRNARNETNIFSGENAVKVLQGIYLQPDPVVVKLDPIFFKTLQGGNEGIPDIVQRLAKQLDIECKGMTLYSKNGERIVFWCSNFIRHSMAPDNSSITFAGKNELMGHWLVCTDIYLNRDWTWDGLKTRSLKIERSKCWGRNQNDLINAPSNKIGELEIRRTASYQSIQKGEDDAVNRSFTRILIIDAIDTKPFDDMAAGHDEFYPFPDCILLAYKLTPAIKKYDGVNDPAHDAPFNSKTLELPITINPKQTPRILSAGIALSPYIKNERYSSTEPRKRFLWLEFERTPADDKDDLFCRMLAYAPDQLISNNHPDLMEIPGESALPIDPEYIRVVIPDPLIDHSGLNAMQKMEKSTDQDKAYYLVPVPPGLHPESPELFGMFTYEFRFGHSNRTWSTAQGRFGRALRVAGIQFPAPTLRCSITHDQEMICVSAPYAKAVFNGKNVTSKPPRTSMWSLLYAQVKQADGKEYRNILLNVIELKKRTLEEELKRLHSELAYLDSELGKKYKDDPKEALYLKDQMEIVNKQIEMLPQEIRIENETGIMAYGKWLNAEVRNMLSLYGLPLNSPLSVICVEIFGQITNIFDHINDLDKQELVIINAIEYVRGHKKPVKDKLVRKIETEFNNEIALAMDESLEKLTNESEERHLDPLNSQLGFHRILRTSPLTEVPAICCKVECEE